MTILNRYKPLPNHTEPYQSIPDIFNKVSHEIKMIMPAINEKAVFLSVISAARS